MTLAAKEFNPIFKKEGMKMVPTHIRLYEEQYEWLRQYCFDQRISQAEVVREALELYRREKSNMSTARR